MDLQLTGKRALVTGSTSGIGEGVATVLAKEGSTVVIQGRNEERARRAAALIEKETREERKALGGLDILVNNAGGADGPPQGWNDATTTDWNALFEQNVFSDPARSTVDRGAAG